MTLLRRKAAKESLDSLHKKCRKWYLRYCCIATVFSYFAYTSVQIVHVDPETGYLAVSYSEMLPIVVEGMKELLKEFHDERQVGRLYTAPHAVVVIANVDVFLVGCANTITRASCSYYLT